jgi:FemAB-related protein (PEP-CTERM system-associated)
MSLPFLVYGGAIATDQNAEEMLVNTVVEFANEIGTDYVEFRNREASGRNWISKETYATFSRQLDPDPEKNLLSIPRKQRAMIRKGIKAELRAESDDDVERLYEALLACKRNLGTPFFGRRYLHAVKAEFGDKAEILTVTSSGETVCSVMSFRFRNEILPYYGGGGDAARDLKGNDFMYWAVMEKACQEGVEIFDYGRSMIGSGAYRFKKHWGFEPKTLAYEYLPVRRQSTPNLNPSNPKYRVLIDAWKRLPLTVAAHLGPPIARRLG